MKLIQFAVASIVDANTGGRLAGQVSSIDTAVAERDAHKIRARSIIALGSAVIARIKARIASYRERAKSRRALDDLLRLSDRHLADIGLHRGDLIAVKLGITTLEALDAERESQRNVTGTGAVTRVEENAVAINDEGLVAVKCA